LTGNFLGYLGAVPCCFCFPNPYRIIEQGFVGIFTRFGKYTRTVDPGVYYVNIFTESYSTVDIKVRISDLGSQLVITKDNVNIFIDSVIYWQVVDPYKSIYHIENISRAVKERAMTVMRQVIGYYDLQNCVTNRESLAEEIKKIVSSISTFWGISVDRILIKDIKFSTDLQENLSSAAKQKRLGAITKRKSNGDNETSFWQL
jgi:erythrocyte band 7 integral membrane protein